MMEQSDEQAQEASLELYKSQLSQVTQAIQAAGVSEDLSRLQSDLEELIKLTEDNLLEIKRSKLLQMIGPPEDDEEEDEDDAGSGDVDDEYAAFQAAIADESSHISQSLREKDDTLGGHTGSFGKRNSNAVGQASSPGFVEGNRPFDNDEDGNDDDDDEEEDALKANERLSELVGTKCRAPFSQEWGDHHYGNALILSVNSPELEVPLDECLVDVIFINPTHQSMVPCPFFMDGKCRFSAQDCRSSHGHSVKVTELHPFVDPDHSKLRPACRCLAKPSGQDVWLQAVVVDVCDDLHLSVRFENSKEEDVVLVEHAIPLDHDDDSDGSESDSDSTDRHRLKRDSMSEEEEEEEEVEEEGVTDHSWKPLQTTEKLGAWERHTKGIGSKLMARMGYVTGQGLGRYGEGRAEPVPITLLPQGKSLDKIMELKAMAGNADLFNAMKKMERRQKAMEKQDDKRKQMGRGAEKKTDVFGFLNQHLGKMRGDHHHHHHHHHHRHTPSASSSTHPAPSASSSSSAAVKTRVSSEKDLTKRSDKEVNVQILQTEEAIRGVEKTLAHLHRQLARNQDKDRKMAENVRQKIAAQENDLRKLKRSSQALESHKTRRKDNKKLTVF